MNLTTQTAPGQGSNESIKLKTDPSVVSNVRMRKDISKECSTFSQNVTHENGEKAPEQEVEEVAPQLPEPQNLQTFNANDIELTGQMGT